MQPTSQRFYYLSVVYRLQTYIMAIEIRAQRTTEYNWLWIFKTRKILNIVCVRLDG